MKCPFCGMENDRDAVYCEGCGSDFPVAGGGVYKAPEDLTEINAEKYIPQIPSFYENHETDNGQAPYSVSASDMLGADSPAHHYAPGFSPHRIDTSINDLPEVKVVNYARMFFIAFLIIATGFFSALFIFREKSPYDTWVVSTPMDNLNMITSYSISGSGNVFSETTLERAVKIWTSTPLVKKKEVRYIDRPFSCALTSAGDILAVGGEDNDIKLYNPSSLALVKKFRAHKGNVYCLAFSPDGNKLVSGGFDGKVKIWNMVSFGDSREISSHTGYVMTVSFSSDGKRFASGGQDGKVHIYDADSGKILTTLPVLNAYIYSTAFHPGGKIIAVGSEKSDVELYDVMTGDLIKKISGHKRGVGGVAFSPDGNYLISAGMDKTLKIWGMTSFRCLKTFKFDYDAFPLAVSPDNSYILCGRHLTVIKEKIR
ncbi:MAG: hypothetical protein LWY06_07950 [Firmicutes bacterium]|nr:hypothetical protein [Bacillota bacterium]